MEDLNGEKFNFPLQHYLLRFKGFNLSQLRGTPNCRDKYRQNLNKHHAT